MKCAIPRLLRRAARFAAACLMAPVAFLAWGLLAAVSCFMEPDPLDPTAR